MTDERQVSRLPDATIRSRIRDGTMRKWTGPARPHYEPLENLWYLNQALTIELSAIGTNHTLETSVLLHPPPFILPPFSENPSAYPHSSHLPHLPLSAEEPSSSNNQIISPPIDLTNPFNSMSENDQQFTHL